MRGATALVAILASGTAACTTHVADLNTKMQTDMRGTIGEKRHFRGSARVCEDRQMTRCYSPGKGHATVEAVPDFATNERPLYQIKLNTGATAFILLPDWTGLKSDRAAVAEDEEAAVCRRKGGPAIGMTAKEVKATCWGEPGRVNATHMAAGTNEQWVYGSNYVYLRNGVVTSIQTSSR